MHHWGGEKKRNEQLPEIFGRSSTKSPVCGSIVQVQLRRTQRRGEWARDVAAPAVAIGSGDGRIKGVALEVAAAIGGRRDGLRGNGRHGGERL